MLNARAVTICAFGGVFLAQVLEGQGLSQYRNFTLRSDLAAVATLAGVTSAEAKTIHQRPAVLQDLEWRPSAWVPGSTSVSTDPVEQTVFSFYNDQLFRVVVNYGYDRTEGMTDTDMIEAISAVYGTPVKRVRGTVRIASGVETESVSPVARWGDSEHVVVLYRVSSYRDTFRLIVTDAALDDLARKAAIRATRLDEREAPSREIARQKKERDDGRAATEKARVANKAVFRP
jgi:hypothetical protein